MKLEIPEGMYELSPDDLIKKGDLWSIRETSSEHNTWVPTTWDGYLVSEMPYNVYVRKKSS